MIIPGWLISIVTFPGVIVHEAAHMLFCRLRGIAVLDVCFFRVGNPAGYVLHEPIENFNTAFLVSVGPFIINSLLCVFFCFPALVPMRVFNDANLLSYFMVWLGVSIGMHAFPSTQDAKVLWNDARKAVKNRQLLAIISFPLVVVIYIANILRFFWLDYLYGIGIGLVLPGMLLKQLF